MRKQKTLSKLLRLGTHKPSSLTICGPQVHAGTTGGKLKNTRAHRAPPSHPLSLLSPATHSCSPSASARGSSGCSLSCVHSVNALPARPRLPGYEGRPSPCCSNLHPGPEAPLTWPSSSRSKLRISSKGYFSLTNAKVLQKALKLIINYTFNDSPSSKKTN